MKRTTKLLLVALLMGTLWAGDQSDRKALRRADPEYPELARKNGLHGTVKLKLWITPDGSVRRVDYIGGHPVLADSAVKTAKSWLYEKGPAETTAVVEVTF